MNVKNASIKWLDTGEPYSTQFEDIYFSMDNGLEESEYVFLKHNQLPQRWAENKSFNIAELGFGSGLNFLATLNYWHRHQPRNSQLNYFSFEKYPFSQADFIKMKNLIKSRWPQLLIGYQTLESLYPIKTSIQHLQFFGGSMNLTIYFMDAFSTLSDKHLIQGSKNIDAWYLDGFDPCKNEQLWNQSVYQQIQFHSRANSTFSTYTAAGHVRRGLMQAGFKVSKVKGFGKKREMLTGVLL